MQIDRRRACHALGGALAGWLARPGVAAAAEPGGPAAALAALAARYFADKMDLDPMAASTLLTDARYQGRLTVTIAPQERARARSLFQRVLRSLHDIPAAGLDRTGRLTHAMLGWEAGMALQAMRFPDHLMPIDQFGGVPMALATMAGGEQGQPLSTEQDFDNYLSRLRRLPDWNDQAIANMREGLRRGVTVPGALVRSALPALRRMAAPAIDELPFMDARKHLPQGLPDAARERIERELRDTLARVVQPSMRALVDFLEGPYLRGARRGAGLAELPDGAAWYRHLVRFHTTTDLSPERIHALGLAEVRRIRDAMAALRAPLGYAGDDLTGFLRWHEAESRFKPFADWAGVVRGYTELNARIEPRLPALFGRLPRHRLEVRAMPELQRDTSSPYYQSPAEDGSRPGIFYVGDTVPPPQYHSTWMTALLLHEGQPGHHTQGALAMELPLPDFRRHGWTTAYGEGWALYAESLGHDLGLYDDPNQHLGFLKMELLRAVRLVTDTGLHAMGWSRERSMRYMMDTEGASEASARQATERYMAVPGQALAYKIGALKFQQLRRESAAALGGRFRLADFHDLVLSQGTLPLDLLQQQVRQWVRAGGGAIAAR